MRYISMKLCFKKEKKNSFKRAYNETHKAFIHATQVIQVTDLYSNNKSLLLTFIDGQLANRLLIDFCENNPLRVSNAGDEAHV
jgi:hypothetical protein